MFVYFNNEILLEKSIIKERKLFRKKRNKVVNNTSFFFFSVGDVLRMRYRLKNLIYTFEGLCLKVSYKGLNNPNVSFILRNIIGGIGVEMTFLHYSTRTFFFSIQDYKRKKLFYKHSKLLFLRYKLNRETYVKI